MSGDTMGVGRLLREREREKERDQITGDLFNESIYDMLIHMKRLPFLR